MGWGVDNGDRFSDYLEMKYQNLDVMNFGASGTGTDQQLLIYENIAKLFEADAYIFAPCTINIIRNELDLSPTLARHPSYRPKPYFTLENASLVLHNVPVPNEQLSEVAAAKRLGSRALSSLDTSPYSYKILRVLPERVRQSDLFNRLSIFVRNPYSGYGSESSDSWRLMWAILQRFIQQAQGKPVFIIPLPTYHHFILNLPPTYVSRFAELHNPEGNCFMINVLPYFSRLSSDELKQCKLVNDPHYSPPLTEL